MAIVLAVTTVCGATLVDGTAAAAATCRESSTIPETSYFVLRSSDGRNTMQIQRGILNRQQFIRVWLNSRFVGAQYLPAPLIAGQVAAIFRTRTRTQIWMGQVQQVTESVAVLQVCGTGWIPVTFY